MKPRWRNVGILKCQKIANNQQVTKKVFSMYPSMYLSMYFLKSLPSQRNTRNTTIKCPPKGNKFKKSNVEAFFYWNEIQRLMWFFGRRRFTAVRPLY